MPPLAITLDQLDEMLDVMIRCVRIVTEGGQIAADMTRLPGLFVTGTDTGVGKTCVAAAIARGLAAKAAASGCSSRSPPGRPASATIGGPRMPRS